MRVRVLPALEDNFMYLIINKVTREAAVVDPVNAKAVAKEVQEENLKLTKVLTTHHHWDHSGGNEELNRLIPGLQFYGGDDRVPALTCKVSHGNVIEMDDVKIECLYTPGHTQGHISYYVTHPESDPAVFTGDTLFSAGCGRLFEGSAEDMYKSLNSTLGSLPNETQVFCGHEYTVNNLKFAKFVEPDNLAIKERLEWACTRLKNKVPTVPSTIGDEKKFNPFMRVCDKSLKDHTKESDPIKVLAAIRKEKDSFKC